MILDDFEISYLFLKIILIGLTPAIFAGVVYLMTHRYEKHQHNILRPNFLIIVFVFNYLFQVTLLKNMVEFIACTTINDIGYLKTDMGIVCTDYSEYNILVFFFNEMILIVKF